LKTFRDNKRRVWTLEVNVAAIKRVRGLCKVDLNSIVEVDAENRPTAHLLEQLSSDPVLLVDVLYAICKPEADKLGVSDEDFGESMAGDAIEQATEALLDEIVDFFPSAKRQVMKKILNATRRFEEIARTRLDRILQDEQFEAKLVSSLEQSNVSFWTAPESSE
jgi:hypothetical protein